MKSSYKQILRSSSIIGGASVINILFGIVRMKVAALLVGAAGVGLLGVYQNLVTTVASAASLGFGSTGVRQVAEAEASGDAARVLVARKALFWGTAIFALIGGAVLFLLRRPVSRWLFQDETFSTGIGVLAVAVALTVVTTSQIALLTGFRRIREVASVNVFGSVAATVGGAALLFTLRERGIVPFVLVVPAALALAALFYIRRLPAARGTASTRAIASQWNMMARLGLALTISGVVVNLAQLAVRGFIQQELGLPELGQFQAVWTISMTYVGFVLQAMGTDYFPRLTASASDLPTANRLVNEQTEVALLLAGPVLLATAGLAPWILALLYSSEFVPAAAVLRWQIAGDFLKIASWPMGFLLLATGSARSFLFGELAAIGTFTLVSWLALPHFGLAATGMAFLAMYILYLPLVFLIIRRMSGFAWSARVVQSFAALGGLLLAVTLAAGVNTVVGGLAGIVAASIYAALAIARLRHALPAPIARLLGSRATGEGRDD